MAELENWCIIRRVVPEAPHETFLTRCFNFRIKAWCKLKATENPPIYGSIVLTRLMELLGDSAAIRENSTSWQIDWFSVKKIDIGEFNSENFMKGLLEA